MGEKIAVSLIGDVSSVGDGDRDKFYNKMFAPELAGVTNREVITNAVLVAPHIFAAVLFNRAGQLILQVRATHKKHNPGMTDKTVGGHVEYADLNDPVWTGVKESAGELNIALVSVRRGLYEERVAQVAGILDKTALTAMITETPQLMWLRKVYDGKTFLVPNMVYLYFGIYFGGIIPRDGEAAGIAFREANPGVLLKDPYMNDVITDDLKQILTMYRSEVEVFSQMARKIGGVTA